MYQAFCPYIFGNIWIPCIPEILTILTIWILIVCFRGPILYWCSTGGMFQFGEYILFSCLCCLVFGGFLLLLFYCLCLKYIGV